jgi:hypothetical protein
VEPAIALYELLMAEQPRRVRGAHASALGPELDWLPEGLRQPAAALLAS